MKKAIQILTIFVVLVLVAGTASALQFNFFKKKSETKTIKYSEQKTTSKTNNAYSYSKQTAKKSSIPKITAKKKKTIKDASKKTVAIRSFERKKSKTKVISSIKDLQEARARREFSFDQNKEDNNQEDQNNGPGWFSGASFHTTAQQALTYADPMLQITNIEVTGDTTEGNTFTITVTAEDGDDLVTKIALAPEPYGTDDYVIKDCVPASNSCTLSFDMSKSSSGTYDYLIKAKNEQNDKIGDAVTVTIVEDLTADTFNFRTAAVDGPKFEMGVIEYVNTSVSVRDGTAVDLVESANPFLTFSAPSDTIFAVSYTESEYLDDEDYFYLDSRMPTCAGNECTFAKEVTGVTYTTSCELILLDNHYECTLTNNQGYAVHFDYRAVGDPIGPNTIRRYNPIYLPSSPVVEFGTIDVNFPEGTSYSLSLDNYVIDDDTSKADLNWSVSENENVNVEINPDTHIANLTQVDPNWIGNDIIRLTATDPEGHESSDLIVVRVTQVENDPPVITSKDPNNNAVNVMRGNSMLFSIEAHDPDYDLINITWEKDGTVVATNVFRYTYNDTDNLDRTLIVTVSDGEYNVSESWDINIVDAIGSIEGTVIDSQSSAQISAVLVELLDGLTIVDSTLTDGLGHYTMTNLLEGTYDLRFSKNSYENQTISNIDIIGGITTTQNVSLIPLAGTLTGTVKKEITQENISGAIVTVKSGITVIDSTTTLSDGSYSLDVYPGTYTVEFSAANYELFTASNVVILSETTTLLNANLTPLPGTLTGTVRNNITQANILGAIVTVKSGITVIDSTTTLSDGTYSLDIYPGTYSVEFNATGYELLTASNVVIDSASTTILNANLSSPGTLAGIVKDNMTQANISGATVTVKSGITVIDSTTTLSDGSYSLDVYPGTYTVEFNATGYYLFTASNVVISSEATTLLDANLDIIPIVIMEDDFEDNSINLSLWNDTSGDLFEQGGRLELIPPTGTRSYRTVNTYTPPFTLYTRMRYVASSASYSRWGLSTSGSCSTLAAGYSSGWDDGTTNIRFGGATWTSTEMLSGVWTNVKLVVRTDTVEWYHNNVLVANRTSGFSGNYYICGSHYDQPISLEDITLTVP